jgi:hypothetical protein
LSVTTGLIISVATRLIIAKDGEVLRLSPKAFALVVIDIVQGRPIEVLQRVYH